MERLLAIACALIAIFIVSCASQQAAHDQHQGMQTAASTK